MPLIYIFIYNNKWFTCTYIGLDAIVKLISIPSKSRVNKLYITPVAQGPHTLHYHNTSKWTVLAGCHRKVAQKHGTCWHPDKTGKKREGKGDRERVARKRQ